MISLFNYRILILTISLLVFGCSSSKELEQVDTKPETFNEETVETSNDTISPDKQIIVFVNDRVKYEFTKIDTSWSGTVTQFDSNDPQTHKVVQVYDLVPTYGWSEFEEVVEFLNIYTMPDQSEIKNHIPGQLSPQSRVYNFTVFDGKQTRTYSYFNPEGEATSHWESQHIATFGSYLATEMKVLGN
jgi:hypothetical protein